MVGTSPWKKSSRSQQGGQCVEARANTGLFQIRDSKLADSPILTLTPAEWSGLLATLKR
ncbi:DUF397 domain-containing protein [Phytomonospora endophytica]|uniref:DUF397 domain-containing protein n=1 Tax=Phytomonospora endophytica TaxID=714109 RepID=A0A841FBU6_9ACTN|nr:DUF397 domain-containing protein [Phytomonospora endophytica]MBB6033264.1 hypothetical protein [Phytomonospora endophytica]GIG65490.1 hypothetical protein Pen01_17850 [Phytomonospora endophytica]